MDKSPTTEKDIGIITDTWGQYDGKFRELRQRAKDEEEARYKKAKRDKTVPLPKHKIGERVVVVLDRSRSDRSYLLIEVLDIGVKVSRWTEYTYYGIVLKVSSEKEHSKIGHLAHFYESKWYELISANVEEGGIKWIE